MISVCRSSTNNIVVVCQSAVMQEQFKVYSPLVHTFVSFGKSPTRAIIISFSLSIQAKF